MSRVEVSSRMRPRASSAPPVFGRFIFLAFAPRLGYDTIEIEQQEGLSMRDGFIKVAAGTPPMNFL